MWCVGVVVVMAMIVVMINVVPISVVVSSVLDVTVTMLAMNCNWMSLQSGVTCDVITEP